MELQDFLRVVRAHWIGIALITLVGLLAAAGWALVTPKVYTADASAWVTGGGQDTNTALIGDSLAKSRVTSYLEFGSSRAVAQRAIDELGLDATPEALVGQVDVSNPLDSTVIKVSARGPEPEAARDLAEAWLQAMIAQINEADQLDGEGSGGSGGQVEPGAAPAVSLVPIDSARLPSSPSFPNLRLALALGGLIGVALGVAYAFVRHSFDRRVRSAAAIERELEVPVVGTIPLDRGAPTSTKHLREIAEGGGDTSDSRALSEAVRELRTNLQFMNVDHPPRVLVITSPLPGEGKSTLSSLLAVTLAAADQNVVLIDGDMRRPTIADRFGLIEGIGLTDVLSGRAEVDDVLQAWGPSERFHVLGAGTVPPNPSELLASERMRGLLAHLAQRAMVVIDAPPLLPVTDAAILTNRADGAFVIASYGSTTMEMLSRALNNIERANGHVLGVVLNRAPRRGQDATGYGYRYYGDYVKATPADEPLPAATQ